MRTKAMQGLTDKGKEAKVLKAIIDGTKMRGPSVRELAKRVGVSQTYVRILADRLEQRGLVKKDGKRFGMLATQKGYEEADNGGG